MNWSRKSSHSIQCGDFTITRFVVQGKDQFWLWRGADEIGVFDTADKTKTAAKGKAQ